MAPKYAEWECTCDTTRTIWQDCSPNTCKNTHAFLLLDSHVGGKVLFIDSMAVARKFLCTSFDGSVFILAKQVRDEGMVQFYVRRSCRVYLVASFNKNDGNVECTNYFSGNIMYTAGIHEVGKDNWGFFQRKVEEHLDVGTYRAVVYPEKVYKQGGKACEAWETKPENRKHVRTLLEVTTVDLLGLITKGNLLGLITAANAKKRRREDLFSSACILLDHAKSSLCFEI